MRDCFGHFVTRRLVRTYAVKCPLESCTYRRYSTVGSSSMPDSLISSNERHVLLAPRFGAREHETIRKQEKMSAPSADMLCYAMPCIMQFFECVMAVQGHPRSFISVLIERAYSSHHFLRYDDIKTENRHFTVPSHIQRPHSRRTPSNFRVNLIPQILESPGYPSVNTS